jgi:hypothetical protein
VRPSRNPDRPVRHLEWRVRFFAAGALLALAGMYLRLDWVVNAALAVLLMGFLLRFLPEHGEGGADHEGDDATG